ncbi:hypothetical protein [Streptomyces tirandamycinicus]|uniref:Uncharacterized protein n=1 Tax=Streptomyces tirandamycinicus TaxID=2174846 RepID=A0A2S1T1U3_9ACTN|nr:hypothetical protein [Streptomyces tirandamycinicus]AWI32632.1 hypothetical protein DDW44_30400 [Streptomyces tirandamycinicus]
MNLYGTGDTIDVGTTRGPVGYAPGGIVSAHLDPGFLTDRERVLPLLTSWTREQLYALADIVIGEADSRTEGELLRLLRDIGAGEPGSPRVTHIEFVTTSNYEDGVYWDDSTVYVHIDGHDEPVPVDFENPDDDPVQTARDGKFRTLLADYSRAAPPADGAHLVVNLATGEFDVSGKWALV